MKESQHIMTTGKYFNRAVMALDSPHIGHVVRETDDKIVVFGGGKKDMIYLFQKYRQQDVKRHFQHIEKFLGLPQIPILI